MQVFDGHNDVLSRLWRRGDDPAEAFEKDEAHINAKACKAGGFAGGFFALYCPEARKPAGDVFQDDGLLEEPLPDPLDHDWALNTTIGQVGVAKRLEAAGHIRIVTQARDLQPTFDADPIACILHLEGAEGIGPDLLELDVLYAAGLGSIQHAFGHTQ